MNYSKLILPMGLATMLLAGCGGSGDSKTPPKQNMSPTPNASSFTTQADTPYSGAVTAADADMDAITYTVATPPTNGTLVLSANGNFSYTPNAEFVGTDTFSFTASDSGHMSAAANVAITVNVLQVSFNEYSRRAFKQMGSDKPLPLNGRNVTQDVTAANAYDDLLKP